MPILHELQSGINHGLFEMIRHEHIWNYDLNLQIDKYNSLSQSPLDKLQAQINRGLFEMIRHEHIWNYDLNLQIDKYNSLSQSPLDKLQAQINRGLFEMIRHEHIWNYDLNRQIEKFSSLSKQPIENKNITRAEALNSNSVSSFLIEENASIDNSFYINCIIGITAVTGGAMLIAGILLLNPIFLGLGAGFLVGSAGLSLYGFYSNSNATNHNVVNAELLFNKQPN
ncbi:hypothetical protein [Legionella fallonii]|uniref:Uncharacterized protein n=1 Tax=Legionella fallonii LLAP-10 TaxID=1212491 RepID=A0A098G1Z7_9GAMM|nr:hypothetical protein [Legionella fallonii]CEG55994.1 protein of unknown function [Legionella fallonii LLAP-10]